MIKAAGKLKGGRVKPSGHQGLAQQRHRQPSFKCVVAITVVGWAPMVSIWLRELQVQRSSRIKYGTKYRQVCKVDESSRVGNLSLLHGVQLCANA